MIRERIKKTNILRIIFIFFLFFEIVLFAKISNSQNYPDMLWHIDSGGKLLSGEWNFENIIYSPIFSIILNLYYENKESLLIGYFFKILTLIFILILGINLSLLIDFKKITHYKHKKIILLVPILFLLGNPFIIKYSSPFYSDSYAIIAGLFFAFRYTYNILNQSLKDQLNFFYRFFATYNYYFLISLLSLLRYPVVIILLASLIFDGYKFIQKRFQKKISLYLKYFFFLSITILIFLLSSNHIYKSNLDTNSFLLIITFIMASLGFREALSIDLSNPTHLLKADKISEILISNNISISDKELQLSILLGVIILIISSISIIRLIYLNNSLTATFCLTFLLLLSAELYIGYGHYRYSLMLIPSMLLSFSLERKSSFLKTFLNKDIG